MKREGEKDGDDKKTEGKEEEGDGEEEDVRDEQEKKEDKKKEGGEEEAEEKEKKVRMDLRVDFASSDPQDFPKKLRGEKVDGRCLFGLWG